MSESMFSVERRIVDLEVEVRNQRLAISSLVDALMELECTPVGHECGHVDYEFRRCPLHQIAKRAEDEANR